MAGFLMKSLLIQSRLLGLICFPILVISVITQAMAQAELSDTGPAAKFIAAEYLYLSRGNGSLYRSVRSRDFCYADYSTGNDCIGSETTDKYE